MYLSLKCNATIMVVIVLLSMPYGAVIVMLRIRMQSGRDLGKHKKTKARQILNEEKQHFNFSIKT
jgi:hypothetical protein